MFFNLVVYLQVPLWILFYFYGKKLNLKFLHERFIYFWFGIIIFILCLPSLGSYAINQYPFHLLFYYACCVAICYLLLGFSGWNSKPWNERMSLSFLIVFFSSYFWEFPLHIMDLLENGLTSRFLIQFIHVLPLGLFYLIWKIKNFKTLFNRVFIAHLITLGIYFIELQDLIYWIYGTYFIRFLDFAILLSIFFSGKCLELKIE